jgi:cytoskeleton protein RodZ
MSETIGRRLREAREQRHLPLQQVADLTRIRLHYLQALEADDYSLIPSAAQARGFLRNYAEFLNLDLGQALADVQRSRPQETEEVSGPLPKVDIAPDAPRTALPPVEEEPVTRSSWLARFRKAPAIAPDVESQSSEPTATPAEPPQEESSIATAAPEPAVLKDEEKKDDQAESPLEAGEQPEALVEAHGEPASRDLWSRRTSLFHLQIGRNLESPEPAGSDPETVSKPVETSDAVFTPVVEKPEEIFVEIGQKLRKRRELLSLTLDEIERHIKVRAVFVKILEEGAFDKLPSAVQTRGMLANYATFLDLDTDALLLRFADAIQASHRLRYPEKPGGQKSPMRVSPNLPPWRSFIAGDMIFGISMAVLLVAMAVWGVNRVFSIQAEEAMLPTAPSISDVLATSQQPTIEQQVTLIPAADTALPANLGINTPDTSLEASAFDVTISVQVTITVVERTFLRVTVDGEEVLNGRVLSGDIFTYEASDSIEVLTGNAAALRITYNGRDLGLMGNFGEVANRIYTADGVVTPTPVAPATSTPSLTPTITRTPTVTPKVPSPTPSGE